METERMEGLRGVLLSYFDSNVAVILSKLAYVGGPDLVEAVHQLRVSTKKLRALFRLAALLSEGSFDDRREIKRLRKLFKAAGPLRELDVNQSVLDGYELLHVAHYRRLEQKLLRQRREALVSYRKARARFSPSYLDGPRMRLIVVLAERSEEEVQEAAKQFVATRLVEIAKVLPSGYDPERMHKARILLKEAMYVVGLLNMAGLQEPYGTQWLLMAKQASEVAGNWHDREVLQHWLATEASHIVGRRGHSYLLDDVQAHKHTMARDFRKALRMEQQVPESPKS